MMDVELSSGDVTDELGHILRTLGTKAYQITVRTGETADIYDSGHNKVGHWRITDVHVDEDDEAESWATEEEDAAEESADSAYPDQYGNQYGTPSFGSY